MLSKPSIKERKGATSVISLLDKGCQKPKEKEIEFLNQTKKSDTLKFFKRTNDINKEIQKRGVYPHPKNLPKICFLAISHDTKNKMGEGQNMRRNLSVVPVCAY